MQTILYQADGLEMRGDLYRGEQSGLRPGVLVFPEALGLSDHTRERAQRLAERGYIALACDLHGEAAFHSEMPKVMELMGVLRQDPAKIQARAQGALDTLLAQEGVDTNRLAAIGFCFGGTMALELARAGAPLAAVAGFHCTLRTQRPAEAFQIRARILVAIGADDPAVDATQRTAFEEEMRAAKADWHLHVYGGVVHSFTNPAADQMGRPEAMRYDAAADARSWKAMCNLFDEAFVL